MACHRIEQDAMGVDELGLGGSSTFPWIVIVIAPELLSSRPMKPLAVFTRFSPPGKYFDLTRMVPKLTAGLNESLPEWPPATGEQVVRLDSRAVVIVSPALWAMEAGRTALAIFFVHSSGFFALQSKQLVSYCHKLDSMTLKLVE
jgi:hypothetical protein